MPDNEFITNFGYKRLPYIQADATSPCHGDLNDI